VRTVAYITIRLNSKRVPHKNIRQIGGKPLCYHVVNTLLKVQEIDSVFVYCSDEDIRKYIPEGAVFLKRDEVLDGDEIKAKDVYSAFINEVDADIYMAACTTSPFTQVATVRNALQKVQSGDYDSAFTAERVQTFAWYKGCPINYVPQDVPRTQDIEPIFVETSAFFIFTKELWIKHRRRIGFCPYIQEVSKIEAIDIDTQEDFMIADVVADNMRRFRERGL
jgi:CMP-N-acetylneuraminic acid synthetase